MKEFKGYIEGFPTEVVEWMNEQQVKQGNSKNIAVFEDNRYANQDEGGFNWEDAGEECGFCNMVIVRKQFDKFFEKYPKKPQEKKQFWYDEFAEITKGYAIRKG